MIAKASAPPCAFLKADVRGRRRLERQPDRRCSGDPAFPWSTGCAGRRRQL